MADDVCEECGGTDDLRPFYGREKCRVSDRWLSCSSCRRKYLDLRLRSKPKTPKKEPEPKATSGQTDLTAFL